jgi:hypothetical protein
VWLFKVPASATRLELRHEGVGGITALLSLNREELGHVNNPGELVLEAAQDHCDSVRARVSFQVVWMDESAHVLGTKAVRCSPQPLDDDDDDFEPIRAGAGSQPRESASVDGIVSQLMRHVENRERMLNIALGTNLRTMHDQLREARAEADQLRGELRNERTRARELEQLQAGGDVDDVESVARAEAYSKVTDAIVSHLVPLAAARLRGSLQ